MNTNLDLKRLLGILMLMLMCSLAVAINVWVGRSSEEGPDAQNAVPSGPAQRVSFFLPLFFLAGTQPRFVVTGDFNEDGALDLAVANTAGVSVFIGNGDGSFRPPVSFAAGPGAAYAIAVGDFDGDEHLDLAVASFGSVSLLLGNGQGAFGSPRSFLVEPVPSSIAVGDFNGDEYLDLAVASGQNGIFAISVLLGDGGGDFPVARRISTLRELRAVTVGDFNNEGKLDLALARMGYLSASGRFITYNPGAVTLLQGDGQGRFASMWNHEAQQGTTVGYVSIAVADVNQDENLDLVAINSSRGATVFLGNGQGDFQAPRYFALGPGFVAIGDFDLDGNPDLVVTQGTDHRVAVLLGDGTGNFGSPIFFSTGLLPNSIAVGDFNSDDVPDLVTADLDSGTVSILINTTFE
jgi:hypothetical protein